MTFRNTTCLLVTAAFRLLAAAATPLRACIQLFEFTTTPRRVASTITHMYTKFYSIFGGPANWDFMSINTTRPPRNFDSILCAPRNFKLDFQPPYNT
ncbi:hypothetical protein C8R43DRAFT_1131572 [Mycena crocata]|nr:hypothetical protein C8R43DRAFT_1131572 [Mycena crocata]